MGRTIDLYSIPNPVGASLLAMAAAHSTSSLPDPTQSRAGSLPQGICVDWWDWRSAGHSRLRQNCCPLQAVGQTTAHTVYCSP
nr:hypothetical protein FEE99_05255 [Pseudomonas sp. ef1]